MATVARDTIANFIAIVIVVEWYLFVWMKVNGGYLYASANFIFLNT